MITVWITICLGSIMLVFSLYALMKNWDEDPDNLLWGLIVLIVAVVMVLIIIFKTYTDAYTEASIEHHRFKDRVVVVGHGKMRIFASMGALKCFEEEAPEVRLKINYNIFGKEIGRDIKTECDDTEKFARGLQSSD